MLLLMLIYCLSAGCGSPGEISPTFPRISPKHSARRACLLLPVPSFTKGNRAQCCPSYRAPCPRSLPVFPLCGSRLSIRAPRIFPHFQPLPPGRWARCLACNLLQVVDAFAFIGDVVRGCGCELWANGARYACHDVAPVRRACVVVNICGGCGIVPEQCEAGGFEVVGCL